MVLHGLLYFWENGGKKENKGSQFTLSALGKFFFFFFHSLKSGKIQDLIAPFNLKRAGDLFLIWNNKKKTQ